MRGGAIALFAISGLGLLLWSEDVLAAGCKVSVSTQTTEVQAPVVVQLSCDQAGGEEDPTNPRLELAGAAEQDGPSRGTSQRIEMHNFSVVRSKTTTFTWTVYATKPGELVIGPVSADTAEGKYRSNSIKVKVLAAGDPNARVLPRRQPDPFGFDPFDFMRGRTPPSPSFETIPRGAPDLDIAEARSEPLFIHAIVSSSKAVIGEPIHVRVYVYSSSGAFEAAPITDLKAPDFLSFPVELEPPLPTELAEVGGESYRVMKIHDVWLVPLRSGKFSLGRFAVRTRSRVSLRAPLKDMKSETISVEVVEPPSAGRPLTYRPGDVGELSLETEVSPRSLQEGDYFELRATLSGTGALPSRLSLPENSRIEWQEPRLQGGPKADPEKLGGTRVITISGRVKGPGPLAPGSVELPFFNPKTKRYETLRSNLGELSVSAAPNSRVAAGAPTATTSGPPAGDLPLVIKTPRRNLDARAERPFEPKLAWFFAPPGLAALSLGLARLGKLRRRATPRTFVPTGPPPKSIPEIERMVRNGDAKSSFKAMDEALLHALEAQWGENFRGFARDDWAKNLVRLGLDGELARSLEKLGLALVEARYTEPLPEPNSLFADTKRLLDAVSRGKRR